MNSYYYNTPNYLVSPSSTAATATTTGIAGILTGLSLALCVVLGIAFVILSVVGRWKIFVKAGQEGWKSLIPIYSEYTMLKILNMEPLLCLLTLVVGANLMLDIVMKVKLAKAFKKGTGFAIGLILLDPIFEMILGFGSGKYHELPSSK